MQESKNMQFYQIKVAKQTNSRNEWAAVEEVKQIQKNSVHEMNCNSLSSLSVVLCRVIKTPRASELPKRCTANCPINPLCRIQRAGSQWVTAPNKIGGQGHRAATKVCRGILLQRENFVSPSSRARSVGT